MSFFGLGFLKKEGGDQKIERRRLDGKTANARQHKLFTSKHNDSIFW